MTLAAPRVIAWIADAPPPRELAPGWEWRVVAPSASPGALAAHPLPQAVVVAGESRDEVALHWLATARAVLPGASVSICATAEEAVRWAAAWAGGATPAPVSNSAGRWAEKVVEGLPGSLVVVVDAACCYQLLGGDAWAAAGIDPTALLGRPVEEAGDASRKEETRAFWREVLGGQTPQFESRMGGRLFLFHGYPLRDAGGRVEGGAAVGLDITAERALRQRLADQERRFRRLFTAAPQALWVVDGETGRFLASNHAASRLLGYEEGDWLSLRVVDLAAPGQAERLGRLLRHPPGPGSASGPWRMKGRDGVWREMELTIQEMEAYAQGARLLAVLASPAGRILEAEAKGGDPRLRPVLAALAAGVAIYDADLRLGVANHLAGQWRQQTAAPLLLPRAPADSHLVLLESGEPISEANHPVALAARTGQPQRNAVLSYLAPPGTPRWFRLDAVPVTDGSGRVRQVVATLWEITDELRAVRKLRTSLQEKEVLLKEVYHRVKNNLQIVASLVAMQARAAEPGSGQAALQAFSARVAAMALVHQQLYQAHTVEQLDLGPFVRELSRHLLQTFAVEPGQVELQVEAEPVPVPLSAAMPIGLILNELVANAFKHAFRDGRRGFLRVGVSALPGGRVCVLVEDDGGGAEVPPADAGARRGGLGTQIVRSLVRQLRGQVSWERAAGMRVRLEIPIRRAEGAA